MGCNLNSGLQSPSRQDSQFGSDLQIEIVSESDPKNAQWSAEKLPSSVQKVSMNPHTLNLASQNLGTSMDVIQKSQKVQNRPMFAVDFGWKDSARRQNGDRPQKGVVPIGAQFLGDLSFFFLLVFLGWRWVRWSRPAPKEHPTHVQKCIALPIVHSIEENELFVVEEKTCIQSAFVCFMPACEVYEWTPKCEEMLIVFIPQGHLNQDSQVTENPSTSRVQKTFFCTN